MEKIVCETGTVLGSPTFISIGAKLTKMCQKYSSKLALRIPVLVIGSKEGKEEKEKEKEEDKNLE